jgi:hypothetical protein
MIYRKYIFILKYILSIYNQQADCLRFENLTVFSTYRVFSNNLINLSISLANLLKKISKKNYFVLRSRNLDDFKYNS